MLGLFVVQVDDPFDSGLNDELHTLVTWEMGSVHRAAGDVVRVLVHYGIHFSVAN